MWTSTAGNRGQAKKYATCVVPSSKVTSLTVMLAELTWQTLEPYPLAVWFHEDGCADQIVDSRLTTLVARFEEYIHRTTAHPQLGVLLPLPNGLFMLLCSIGRHCGFAEIKIMVPVTVVVHFPDVLFSR